MFADSSFNSEIVKIECGSLVSIIEEIYGKDVAKLFLDNFNTLFKSHDNRDKEKYKAAIFKFVLDTAKSILTAVVMSEFKTRLGIL